MSLITDNLQAVRTDLRLVAQNAGRNPDQITLLAVSKTFPAEAVLEAIIAGQRCFGENYLQEALDKIERVQQLLLLTLPSIVPAIQPEWHFIGPIQSNKTRPIAENFSWVHAVDRLKIAQRLSEQRPANLPALNICLQINISDEASKSGVPVSQAVELALQIAQLPHLKLRGLMAIPEPAVELEVQRTAFRRLHELKQEIHSELLKISADSAAQFNTLSMGMSADMHAAILEGSSLVRIGSAIFGQRNYAR